MKKLLQKFTLILSVSAFIVGCSSPNYYVFRTQTHTPKEQKEGETEIKEEVQVAKTQENEEKVVKSEYIASIEDKVTPLQQSIYNKIDEKIDVENLTKPEVDLDKKALKSLRKDVMKDIRKFRKENKEFIKEIKGNKEEIIKSLSERDEAGEGKSQVIALILVLLVGGLGIHRFYLGYTGIGIIQLLTLGGCGIWALVDLIRIITGDLQPKDGSYTKTL